jgi:dipeptidyl aminopeptidase/acylaminoacyl peptidase
VDGESGEGRELTPHDDEARYVPGPCAADGSGFYLLSDEGREYVGLAFFRFDEGRLEWVETPDADIEDLAGSRDGRVLAWLVNERGWSRLRLRDLETGALLPEPELPSGCGDRMGSALTVSRDGRFAAILWTQPRRPSELYVIETATGRATRVSESMLGGLTEEELVAPDEITYESFDGREIPAWLYLPHDRDGEVPVVLSIHGGPEAQERPWYQPFYQYLVSRGFVVLAPNIRGSSGYGKTYQKLIHRDWGGGDLRDFEALARWLQEQDFVDGGRLGVYGGSYGGFATLTCVTRLPDYWAAAVDIVGPSNLVTFSKAVPPTWRRFLDAWVGNPDTEADFLLERSPITYVENVRAPLLVMQGAHDPRVVKGESDQMVERLRELGREVDYVVFEDEGHGFTKRQNQQRAYRLAADWFERHLSR